MLEFNRIKVMKKLMVFYFRYIYHWFAHHLYKYIHIFYIDIDKKEEEETEPLKQQQSASAEQPPSQGTYIYL